MRKWICYIACIIQWTIIPACSSLQFSNDYTLVLTDWRLVSVRINPEDSFETPRTRTSFLRIERDRHYNGNAYCNSFGGKITVSGRNISFESGMSTMRGCPQAEKYESLVGSALHSVDNYSIVGRTLYLKQGNIILMIYTA